MVGLGLGIKGPGSFSETEPEEGGLGEALDFLEAVKRVLLNKYLEKQRHGGRSFFLCGLFSCQAI